MESLADNLKKASTRDLKKGLLFVQRWSKIKFDSRLIFDIKSCDRNQLEKKYIELTKAEKTFWYLFDKSFSGAIEVGWKEKDVGIIRSIKREMAIPKHVMICQMIFISSFDDRAKGIMERYLKTRTFWEKVWLKMLVML